MQLLTQVPSPRPQLSRSEKCAASVCLCVSQPGPIKYDYHKIPTYGSLSLSLPALSSQASVPLNCITSFYPMTRSPGLTSCYSLH